MVKKKQISYKDIEKNLKTFTNSVDPTNVGYNILSSFGYSEHDIRRWDEGKGVLKTFDGLLIKNLFCYRQVSKENEISSMLENLKNDIFVMKATPKIIAVSDEYRIMAYDTREKESYDNLVKSMHSDFAFFYPLIGIEKVKNVDESPADIKAAEKLAKIHDEIRAYNDFDSDDDLHDLNIFIARLLFCYFAEDTGLFEDNLFTNSIRTYTKTDGSDLSTYLDETFNVMDTSVRSNEIPSIVKQFPYVNGGLFSKKIKIPKLSVKARKLMIECGELDWSEINPDIFGSMIQAVVNPEVRSTEGMHYTSVPNIMKVINPLFLDELHSKYNSLKDYYEQQTQMHKLGAIDGDQYSNEKKSIYRQCRNLLIRMSRMKFFDPACGSGNFLIITYKSLLSLEMDIRKLEKRCQDGTYILYADSFGININQFYGIEVLDFPHEIAVLSLWLAEHQMHREFEKEFKASYNDLPLKNIQHIMCGNACRMDWKEVCPHDSDEEVFIFGNPPYLGSRRQDKTQKEDMKHVFQKDFGQLDYICTWFLTAANYIKETKAKYAFVTTNSICQGLHVGLLWNRIFAKNLSINFAYKSFKWQNNAKHNAAVTCTIVGVANNTNIHERKIYDGTNYKIVPNISPYLMDAPSVIVKSENVPICKWFPQMNFGNMPADGGKLLLDNYDKAKLLEESPEAERFIKPLIGADDFIKGKNRWCIWLYQENEDDYINIPQIVKRINELKIIREKSSRPQLAAIPHLFAQITQPMGCSFILIPRVSSENRDYIPMGYLEDGNIAADSCMVIGTDDISLFGILTSRMHMAWVRTVGGKLKTDYRYSAGLCYNTFPFPDIKQEKKTEIEKAAEEVLLARAGHPEMTLADMYDPETMPKDLRDAHNALDDIVDSCYKGYPFTNDDERLECLFKLYVKMTSKQKE